VSAAGRAPAVPPPRRASAAARRLGGLAWGLVVYLCGVGAIASLVGFLANRAVPEGVDQGAVEPLALAVAVDVGLLLLFGLSHSLTARQRWKELLARLVPPALERSVYTLISALALALVFWQWRPIPEPLWTLEWPPARAAAWTLFAAGWILAIASSLSLGHFELFGLRQALAWSRGEEPVEPPLRARRFYWLVRHPVYLGFLLGTWATPEMTLGHLLFAAVMSGYLLVGMRLEERDLLRRFPGYAAYQARVPALLPWPRRRR
jgi:protein-S-isoprenylcysteine O-methyltransferase Ste14